MRTAARRRRHPQPQRRALATSAGPPVDPLALLRYIADRLDLLDVITDGRSLHDDHPAYWGKVRWILVPVTDDVLAELELFEASAEDLEDNGDDEAEELEHNLAAVHGGRCGQEQATALDFLASE